LKKNSNVRDNKTCGKEGEKGRRHKKHNQQRSQFCSTRRRAGQNHAFTRGKKKQLALVEKMKNPPTRLDDDKSPNLRLDDKSTYTTP
jgi:hypothetical protein